MAHTLAEVQSVVLVSIFKPIVMAVVLGMWAWVVSHLDKDLAYYYLRRRWWNGIQLACGAVAFGLWLVIPIFWVGLPVALLIMAAGVFAYVAYRNARVPEGGRWSFSLDSFQQKLDQRQFAKAQKGASLAFLTGANVRQDVPAGEDPLVPVHTLFEELMDFALPRGAERIDFAVGAQQAAIVVHIDGVKYPQSHVDPRVALTLIDYLKQHAALDVADRRRRQIGTAAIEVEEQGRHALGLLTSGSTREVSLVLSIDPDKRFTANFDGLGLLDSQKKQLLPILDETNRVVLVTCSPHNGLTTTLYSLAQRHDPYTQSVASLEDEIAHPIEGTTQETIPPGADVAWINEKLAQMLRRDPNVMMLSRVTDSSTAKLIANVSSDLRFYVGLQFPDTFTALRAWIKALGGPKPAGQSLTAVVAHRLVRRLCMTCKAPYRPDPAALRKLNLPADKISQLFKESGQVMVKDRPQPCPACLGMGFRGRVAVFEVMTLDDQARQLISAGQLDQLRAYLRKQKMLWLQEAALAKVVDGVTSISEITRALSKEGG